MSAPPRNARDAATVAHRALLRRRLKFDVRLLQRVPYEGVSRMRAFALLDLRWCHAGRRFSDASPLASQRRACAAGIETGSCAAASGWSSRATYAAAALPAALAFDALRCSHAAPPRSSTPPRPAARTSRISSRRSATASRRCVADHECCLSRATARPLLTPAFPCTDVQLRRALRVPHVHELYAPCLARTHTIAHSHASLLLADDFRYDIQKGLRPRKQVRTAMQHEIAMYAIAQVQHCLESTPRLPTLSLAAAGRRAGRRRKAPHRYGAGARRAERGRRGRRPGRGGRAPECSADAGRDAKITGREDEASCGEPCAQQQTSCRRPGTWGVLLRGKTHGAGHQQGEVSCKRPAPRCCLGKVESRAHERPQSAMGPQQQGQSHEQAANVPIREQVGREQALP